MANPYYVAPPSLQGLGQIGAAYFQNQEQEEAKAAQAAKQQEAAGILERGDMQEISNFMINNPEMAQGVKQSFGFMNEQTEKNAVDTAMGMLSGGDSDSALRDRAAMISQQGGDPSDTLALLDVPEDERQKVAQFTLASFGSPAQIKAVSDLTGGGTSETKVGAQEILEDGTVIQSTPTGTKVYTPQGDLVTGQAAADAIREGRAEKVSNLRKAAGEKKLATLEAQNELQGEVEAGVISQKEAANASIKAFDKIEAINDKIGLYDEGIALIDSGAGTGKIEGMFPSFKANTIKLNNLANRLGLDVVANTTFGALSAGELDMAMKTAMPTGLDEQDLKEWLMEKKDAQERLADYLESAAIYLGTPGNTKVGWLKKKKLEKRQKANQPQQNQAPQSAVDYLMANPQAADQFKAKFGYLPEGM